MGTFRETLAEGNEGALHQGIYTLINHYTDVKDIGDNVKMLLEGSEFTKEDRESQLYDDFEHFCQNKGETIYVYYVRFTKLINDYSSQSSTTPPSTYVPPVTYQPHFVDNTQLDLELSLMDKLIENLTNIISLLTQSYKAYLPQTNNQLRTSSNTKNQATVQDGRVVVQNVQGRQNKGQGNNVRETGAAGKRGDQNRVGNANLGQSRQIKCYNCNGGQDNVVDEDVDELPVQDLALNMDNVFQADECDAFDSDVVEAPTA
uniref:Integrase, catalytic region, zinc finger, CCHC-type, peptidase aspartic, catalytic n=1 Tax=Tanacetum cinerariifolium TaxID=118510 RepID=A0A6L2LQE2_TANCI|nr:hypothetical protein [Tanacetum cinerariifolium]